MTHLGGNDPCNLIDDPSDPEELIDTWKFLIHGILQFFIHGRNSANSLHIGGK